MDFYLDPTTSYLSELTTSPGMSPVMRILEEVFNPNGTKLDIFRDCVLISLDTEYDTQASRIDQIGISKLDTRRIQMADDEDSAKEALTSELLLLRKQRFGKRGSKKGAYLFGDARKCYDESLDSLLLPILTIEDPWTRQPRNIILVGHSVRCDILEIKRSCGMDLMALPMIKAVVDTSPLMHRVYNTANRYNSLRDTCTLLGIYKRNIHTAGNDAMYALKALLLIFCHYMEEKLRWQLYEDDRALLYQCQLEAIRRIGRRKNGISKFQRQREKKRQGQNRWKDRNLALEQRVERAEGYTSDMLADNTIDGGFMDALFIA